MTETLELVIIIALALGWLGVLVFAFIGGRRDDDAGDDFDWVGRANDHDWWVS